MNYVIIPKDPLQSVQLCSGICFADVASQEALQMNRDVMMVKHFEPEPPVSSAVKITQAGKPAGYCGLAGKP